MMNLGDLSGGEEQIDRAFGNTPKPVEMERQLLNITSLLYYKNYEAELKMHSGGFPEGTLRLNGSHKDTTEVDFVKKCLELIKPLVDELNDTKRKELESERLEIIKQLKE